MGLEVELSWSWPVLVVTGALALVFTSFVCCAVSEVVARFAARLCSESPAERERRVEEWVGTLVEMQPRERPMHAGSLLWLGFRQRALRRRSRGSVRALVDALEEWMGGRAIHWRLEYLRYSELDRALMEALRRHGSLGEAAREFGMTEEAFSDRVDFAMRKLERAGLPVSQEGDISPPSGTITRLRAAGRRWHDARQLYWRDLSEFRSQVEAPAGADRREVARPATTPD